jgi:hypothetical protein
MEFMMDFVKKLFILFLLGFSGIALSASFPTGEYKGVGFTVEKGAMKMTETDMSKFESNLKIIDKGDSRVAFDISVKMQRSPGMQVRTDRRFDVYQVSWTDENSGQLVNIDKKYSADKSTFLISGNKLTIKSWISRNQLHETHIYEKK